jgi:hypothetical protein
VKPDLPQDERVGRVSREARLCWLLCFTVADDAGRFRAHPALLAGVLYPYDALTPEPVEGWLRELDGAGLLICYQDGSQQYAEIPNWLTHQRIDHPAETRFPDPVDCSRTFSDIVTRISEGPRVSRLSCARVGAFHSHPKEHVLNTERTNTESTREVARFTSIWNENCSPLPGIRKPPTRRDPVRLVLSAWGAFDGDEAELGAAIRRCALDPHYREGSYGFETFCRHLDRFTSDPVAPQTQQERDRETIAQRYAGGGIVVDMEGTT